MSKFHNVKTTNADGIVFDSKREAARYEELRMLEMAGQIRGLERQRRWPLHADGGIVVGHYVSDFGYDEKVVHGWDSRDDTWVHVEEDSKGMRTQLYRWKARHFKAEYGYAIRET